MRNSWLVPHDKRKKTRLNNTLSGPGLILIHRVSTCFNGLTMPQESPRNPMKSGHRDEHPIQAESKRPEELAMLSLQLFIWHQGQFFHLTDVRRFTCPGAGFGAPKPLRRPQDVSLSQGTWGMNYTCDKLPAWLCSAWFVQPLSLKAKKAEKDI